MPSINSLQIIPVTQERWGDMQTLFGPRGATGGCWCMFLRVTAKEFDVQKGEGNRQEMGKIIDSGEVPGLIAYVDGVPAGWCSVAPREAFPRLERSRVAKRLDEQPVWSVICFFIGKDYRRSGLSVKLLQGAVEYAKAQGAQIIEGYPVEPRKGSMPDVFAWQGLAEAFREVGFIEVARRTETRPMMRYVVEAN